MKLNDARGFAVRKQVRIRFRTPGGMECLLDEHGLSRVPDLKASSDLNLEDEFSRAGQFQLEAAVEAGKRADLRTVSRAELEALVATRTAAVREED
jgi:hypothetical protein